MNFDLDEDQRLLRDLVDRLAADRYPLSECPRHSIPVTGFSADNWAMFADLGLLAVPIPAEAGGLGGGPVEIMVVMEALGRALVTEPYFAKAVLAGRALALIGGNHAMVDALVAGNAHFALAWAEPGRRFAMDPVCRALTGQGATRLSGIKTFVTGGTGIDHLLVTASDAEGAARVYLVAMSDPGVSQRTYRTLEGVPAMEVTFDNAVADLLPGPFATLMRVVDDARLAACAEMVGIMQTLLDTTIDYLKTRKQFGVPIGSFQALQHRAAEMYASMELSRSHLYRAVVAAGAGEADAPAAIAAAKAYIARAAITLGEECIQMHGGMGVTNELIIGHGHKRLLVLATLFGDADHELRRYITLAA